MPKERVVRKRISGIGSTLLKYLELRMHNVGPASVFNFIKLADVRSLYYKMILLNLEERETKIIISIYQYIQYMRQPI